MTRIRLLSWNVNGLRSVHKKGFLEWFAQERPDVLCLQETKASEDQLPMDLRQVTGYHAYFSSAERKGYSGVALYTRVEPRAVERGFGIPEFDCEGRILIAHYPDFVLLNIYFPNGKLSEERLRYKMRFYDAFLEFADDLTARGRNVVVCGDVNTAHTEIDLARPRENSTVSGFLPEERAWMDRFVGHGFVDTFRMFNREPGHYTWWDTMTRARERNVGWRIDYFFVNEGLTSRVVNATILPEVMSSDHCPVGLELEVGQWGERAAASAD